MKTVEDLVLTYYSSNDFSMLRERSQKDYKYFLGILVSEFGDVPFGEMTSKQAKHAYEEWVKRGITFANHVCTVSSLVYRYAMEMEYATNNPFANIKRKTPKQRKVVWTEQDIQKFLTFCYSDFAYRNIGLIVHMAYEWCQRLGDMRLLTWDAIDFDTQRLYLEQSKSVAQVTLPISDDLCEMLQQQHDDFGFQAYVAPRPKPTGGSITLTVWIDCRRQVAVMRLAGLSEETYALWTYVGQARLKWLRLVSAWHKSCRLQDIVTHSLSNPT